MTTLYNRFSTFKLLDYIFGRAQPAIGDVADYRTDLYTLYDQYYDNTIYNKRGDGGSREIINQSLSRDAEAPIAGFYNPVSEIVDLYQHVLGGEFGKAITVESENPRLTERLSANGRTLPSPMDRIWRWSNIDQSKQLICRTAAKTGNCGLRVVMQDDPIPARRRVYLKPEHPRIIRDLDTDQRGNITQILLRYDDVVGIGDQQTVTTIEELQTKEAFTRWYVRNGRREMMPFEQYDNDLGVVPYVLLAHQPTGGDWGYNAFYRSTQQIDQLNKLVAHINTQIEDHVRVVWFISADGAEPSLIDLSGTKVIYQDSTRSTNAAVIEPMVADLNLADSLAAVKDQYAQVVEKQPELKAIAGQFLSGQSGETVKELRKPAEDRLALARVNYESALVRAQDLALSMGVLYGLWDLGTGTGTMEAAERAYQEGFEEHTFNDRPLLPVDMDVRTRDFYANAESAQRSGLLIPYLREMGWGDERITEYQQEQQQSFERQQTGIAASQMER